MDKRKKSVQFSVEVFDERDTRCGIPLCPVTIFSDLRFLIPLSLALIFVQGLVTYHHTQTTAQHVHFHDIGQHIGVVLSCIFFSYFGRNHKPRCLGIASILTTVSCFILGIKMTMTSMMATGTGGSSWEQQVEQFWYLGGISHFLNGVALLISVSLGASYFDNNFPRYFPLILGIGAAVKTASSLVTMRTSLWMTFGSLIGLASLPIALLPKVINRLPPNYGGPVVTPTDDPSTLAELRNSIFSVIKSEMVMYNCLASVFFTLGLTFICNERIGMGVQAIGFLLSGWFIQFVKPGGRILAGVNILVGFGFVVHSIVHAFYCRCDFINFAIFSILLFLSCFSRIGAFLFSIRSVERNDKPLAIGLTFGIISLFLIPKSIFIDLTCDQCGEETLDAVNLYTTTTTSTACFDLCCQNNVVPNLIGAGFTSIGLVFAWLVWRHAESLELYKN